MEKILIRLALAYVRSVIWFAIWVLDIERRTRKPSHNATDWIHLRKRVMELREKQERVNQLREQIGL